MSWVLLCQISILMVIAAILVTVVIEECCKTMAKYHGRKYDSGR